MSVRIYDVARRAFGIEEADWETDGVVAVIPKLTYVPNFATDTGASILQPYSTLVMAVMNRSVSQAGWFICDPIAFSSTPLDGNITQVVLFRTDDNMLLLNIEFPPIAGAGRPVVLLQGASRPGLCRL